MGVTARGSTTHLGAVLFASGARVKLNIIPYKGGVQIVIDLMAGNIQLSFGNILNYLPHVKSGRLRALGVTSATRSAAMPHLPTIAESGLPGYDVTTWHGWLAPADTPATIVNKLSQELARAVRMPDIASKLAEDGGEPVGSTPEQFRDLIRTEVPRWRKVIKEVGLTSAE
jgi:tripartite-type tricarboxylate transporter receptor subunit TctC